MVPSGTGSEQSKHMSALSEITSVWETPKAEFNSFFDQAPVGLAQCRFSGLVTALNPALERMLGPHFKLQGHLTLAELIEPQDRRETERQLSDLFDGKRESVKIHSSHGIGSGGLRWTAWRISAAQGHSGSVLVMAEEIPRTSDLDQRLQQLAGLESVGKLAGGLAHDFNNVLTGVLLYCDLLMASLDPSHGARKYAGEIRTAAMQASGLVRQLLAITRPQQFQVRSLSLNEVVEGMRNLLARLIGENIELEFRLDPNLGLIQLDPTQAQQILLNLVLNARDAMPKGGNILIETRNCKLHALTESVLGRSTEASVPCALFVVEDNGCGMDDSTRAHIFEPFFTTKAGKGTGLGLATVHEIVSSSGGLIHVSSEPAVGTRVSVLLPLVPATMPEPSSKENFYPRSNGEVFSSQEEE